MVDLRLGDCLEVLRDLEDCSVDAVVTDPPYGINFMGKAWDGAAIEEAARRERESGRPMPARLTGGHESPSRKLTERTGSAFANRAGEAGAYDFRVGRFGDERDWSRMGGPSGSDNTKHSERGGAMRAGTYDLSGSGMRGFQAWVEMWASECLRVMKPGGHALVFGGTRTYHRLACGLEDAGFEIRDCLAWMFGSGFPKSLDVSKAIDARDGHLRGQRGEEISANGSMSGPNYERTPKGEPVTAAAAAWDGWGTALKPAFEPIVLARKPLAGTVAANVLAHGTGALNVDGCRVVTDDALSGSGGALLRFGGMNARPHNEADDYEARGTNRNDGGRWPANVLLDEDAAAMLDAQTGVLVSGPESDRGHRRNSDDQACRNAYGGFQGQQVTGVLYGDSGGASRFFYCAKVSRAERNAGLDGFEEKIADPYGEHRGRRMEDKSRFDGQPPATGRNVHPTVKPIDLMRWLIRLITPPGGLVLDPFLGSGSTGCAAALEDRPFIGIEREPDYMEIATARIGFWQQHGEEALDYVRREEAAEAKREAVRDAGQLSFLTE